MTRLQLQADDVRRQVRATLATHLGPAVADVPDDTPLPDAFGDRYDSLGALECISLIEQAFDIEVDFVAHDIRYWFATLARIDQFVFDQVEDREITRGVR
jgi:acyl carrier protein